MIITKYPHNGRTNRIKHYSDIGMMIRQNETGYEYAEAIDVYPCKYTYSETTTLIEQEVENGNS